jgi:hypothetical protein
VKGFTLFLLLSSLAISGAQAAPTLLVYSVIRNGSRIGTMTTNIANEGDAVTVITKSDIEVKVIIVLYRFSQITNET